MRIVIAAHHLLPHGISGGELRAHRLAVWLHFDTPRHRTIWGMPMEYPRVNGAPEWHVVEPESVHLVTNLGTGEVSSFQGQELAEGLPITIQGPEDNVLRLTVSQH